MKIVKYIVIAAVALILVLVGVGYVLPDRTHIEHATYIKVAPETVYELMSNLKEFNHWSPWGGADDNIEYQIEQPQRGLNATLRWSSDTTLIGSGRLTIIDAQPYRALRLMLDYQSGGRATLDFALEPLENGTHINWRYETVYGDSLVNRYIGLLQKYRINTLYEPSLDRLRRLAESRPALPIASVTTETINYEVDGALFKGFLAFDQNRQQRPGILIVHDAWGLNDFVREQAGKLAELGYVAFALDLYSNGQETAQPEEAKQMANVLSNDFDAAKTRFMTALEMIKNHPAVDANNIAAIGYGFGGGMVLNMARADIELDGVVSFYGSLTSMDGSYADVSGDSELDEPANNKAERNQVKAAVLVLNGADDQIVTVEQRQAFFEEMDAAGVDYEFINYPGAKHAFNDPAADEYAEKFNLPVAYNANADQQSWQQMHTFLDRIFR